MAQIFISYKRIDKDKVFPIVEKIEHELGCDCWVDLEGIESSVQFASVICSAIDKSDVVLFMHSSAHLRIDFQTDWTVKELNYAHAKKKRVVLVKLDDTPLDNIFLMEYGSKNNIDLQDPTQFNKLLNDLRSWLHLPHQKSASQFEVMCPCGSGKLFKDCHGRSAVAPMVSQPVERTWKVGDYYNVDGKEGVVLWVDETGKHGKIVSLDQAKKLWCTDDEYRKGLTGIASDEYDGMKNLQSIQKISGWRNKYPAFAWCADHGDGWYLPAIKELELLLLNEEVYDANNQIAGEGKAELISKEEYHLYWSSTERRERCAWNVYLYYGYTSYDYRRNLNYVRAVSAF